MRKIKFRAWNKKNKAWVYSDHIEGMAWFWQLLEKFGIENFIINQFTGLKDKNGKEIYEGDVCKATKSFICSISIDLYDGIIMTWTHENARSKLIGSRIEPIWRNHKISLEIIGNIYENPKLLKSGNE